MKHFLYLVFSLSGASASHMHSMAEGTRHKHASGVGVPWGPKKCAELLHSDAGTCVIRTHCDGVDLSKFEFAFDCASSGEIQRHSFGIGGFDDDDGFDTNVKCTTCLPPDAVEDGEETPKPHHTHHEIGVGSLTPARAAPEHHIHQEVAVSKMPSAASFHAAVQKSPHSHHEVVVVGVKLSAAGEDEVKGKEDKTTKEEPPPPPADTSSYGPGNCVSTWRNETTGTCIMQTSCDGQKTADHMFGLICKNEAKGKDSLVRHVFGRDSFNATETFDTLIPCQKCLSMGYVKEDWDTVPKSPLAIAIKNLAGAVSKVKDGITSVKTDVAALKTQVYGKNSTKDGKNSTEEEAAEGQAADAEDAADEEAEDAAKAVNASAPEKNETNATKNETKNETLLFARGVKKHVTIRKPVLKLRGGAGRSSRHKRHQEDRDDADNDEDDSS
jgi:hypothetical protein